MSRQDVYSLLLPFIPSDYHFLEARHRHRLVFPRKGTAGGRRVPPKGRKNRLPNTRRNPKNHELIFIQGGMFNGV